MIEKLETFRESLLKYAEDGKGPPFWHIVEILNECMGGEVYKTNLDKAFYYFYIPKDEPNECEITLANEFALIPFNCLFNNRKLTLEDIEGAKNFINGIKKFTFTHGLEDEHKNHIKDLYAVAELLEEIYYKCLVPLTELNLCEEKI